MSLQIPARTMGPLLVLLLIPLISGCDGAPAPAEESGDPPARISAPAEPEAREPIAPTFADYPAAEPGIATPAPVDLGSHPRAREFRTMLTRGAAEGPNFAGHYTVVTWGCGTMCQEFMIVDARTGRVHDGRTTALGVAYERGSDLLVINPPERGAETRCPPDACAPQYLRWIDDHLEPVLPPAEAEAIRSALLDYVRKQTEVRSFQLAFDAVADGWARVRIIPEEGVTDPATVYLRQEGGVWRVVGIGTAFAPDELNELGVPEGVRPPL